VLFEWILEVWLSLNFSECFLSSWSFEGSSIGNLDFSHHEFNFILNASTESVGSSLHVSFESSHALWIWMASDGGNTSFDVCSNSLSFSVLGGSSSVSNELLSLWGVDKLFSNSLVLDIVFGIGNDFFVTNVEVGCFVLEIITSHALFEIVLASPSSLVNFYHLWGIDLCLEESCTVGLECLGFFRVRPGVHGSVK